MRGTRALAHLGKAVTFLFAHLELNIMRVFINSDAKLTEALLELGWDTMSSRRRLHRLTLMY